MLMQKEHGSGNRRRDSGNVLANDSVNRHVIQAAGTGFRQPAPRFRGRKYSFIFPAKKGLYPQAGGLEARCFARILLQTCKRRRPIQKAMVNY